MTDWNESLRGACQGGNKETIEFVISKSTPVGLVWNWGLYGACQGGNKEIAEWMISKGATDWNGGLYCACKGGHKDMAEWIISKGKLLWLYWNGGLYGACQGGHLHMVEFMINKGATDLNLPFLWQEENQLQLLWNGITRKQLGPIKNIEYLYTKLDILNEIIHMEIFNVLPFRDLVPLCTQYACI